MSIESRPVDHSSESFEKNTQQNQQIFGWKLSHVVFRTVS